jgi:hypothetical protein
MTNGVDRTFSRRPDSRDVDIHPIGSKARPNWENPLGSTSGRGRARPRKTHHATLRAPRRDIIPAFRRRFVEPRGTVIHNEACRWSPRILECCARRIDSIRRSNQRWITDPQRFTLVICPGIRAISLPAIGIHGFTSGTTNRKMKMWTGGIACSSTDTKHFPM